MELLIATNALLVCWGFYCWWQVRDRAARAAQVSALLERAHLRYDIQEWDSRVVEVVRSGYLPTAIDILEGRLPVDAPVDTDRPHKAIEE